jgi:DNA polymerase sigma
MYFGGKNYHRKNSNQKNYDGKNFSKDNFSDVKNTCDRKEAFRKKRVLDRDYEQFMNWRKERFQNAQRKGFFNKFFKVGRQFCPVCGKPMGNNYRK